MSMLLNVVYGQSCYIEYVTVLTFRYLSFLMVTNKGSLRIIIRIKCLVTLVDNENTNAERQRLSRQRRHADPCRTEEYLQAE